MRYRAKHTTMTRKILLPLIILATLFACKKHDNTPAPHYWQEETDNYHLVYFFTDSMYTYNRNSAGVFIIDTLASIHIIDSPIKSRIVIDTFGTYATYTIFRLGAVSDTLYKVGNSFVHSGAHGFSREILSFSGDSAVFQQQTDTLPTGSFHSITRITGQRLIPVY